MRTNRFEAKTKLLKPDQMAIWEPLSSDDPNFQIINPDGFFLSRGFFFFSSENRIFSKQETNFFSLVRISFQRFSRILPSSQDFRIPKIFLPDQFSQDSMRLQENQGTPLVQDDSLKRIAVAKNIFLMSGMSPFSSVISTAIQQICLYLMETN